MKSQVSAKVVSANLCTGCGLCAALCPEVVLVMQWNRYGEYNPVEVNPCTTECGLCLKVCPFSDTEENEDTIGERFYGAVPGIRHRSETGYYLAAYVGYSERHRPTSASGGMATWLLEALLAEGIVDHVICVAPTGDPDKLFVFRIFDYPGRRSATGAGSAYVPGGTLEGHPAGPRGAGALRCHRPPLFPQGDPACPAAEQETPGAGRRHRRSRLRAAEEQALHRLRRRPRRGARGSDGGALSWEEPGPASEQLLLLVHDRRRRRAQDLLERGDRRGLDEPVVHAEGLQLLRRHLCRVRGRHLHGRLAAGVLAGRPGDEPSAGAVAGGA